MIVAAELHYRRPKSGSKRLRKAVEDLLGEIDVLPFDLPADADHGAIRSALEAAGKPLDSSDLLIVHAYATCQRMDSFLGLRIEINRHVTLGGIL